MAHHLSCAPEGLAEPSSSNDVVILVAAAGPTRRGRAMGIFAGAQAVGVCVGPALGGVCWGA